MLRLSVVACALLLSALSSAAQMYISGSQGYYGYGDAPGYGYGSYGYNVDSYYGGSYGYTASATYYDSGYGVYGYTQENTGYVYTPSTIYTAGYGYLQENNYYASGYGSYGSYSSYNGAYGSYGYYNAPGYYYASSYGAYGSTPIAASTAAADPSPDDTTPIEPSDDNTTPIEPSEDSPPPSTSSDDMFSSPPTPPTATPIPAAASTSRRLLSTASAASTSRRVQSTTSSSTLTPPAGQCYCPYDSDWNAWAIVDPRCRSALYTKCHEPGALISCNWLDAYFSAAPSTGGFKRPNEQNIQNFLYNDCPPAPPCSCSHLTFAESDSGADLYQCCNDLKVFAQVPFSGINGSTVDAFCNAGKDAQKVKTWLQHTLWKSECSASTPSTVYTFVPLELQAKQQKAAAATVKVVTAGQEVPSTNHVEETSSSAMNLVTMVSAACGAVLGGALAGVVIVSFLRPRAEQEQAFRYAAIV